MKTRIAIFLLAGISAFATAQTPSFDDYRGHFWDTVSSNFGDVKNDSGATSVFATNAFLSRGMTIAFAKSQVHFEASMPKTIVNPQPSDVDLTVKKVLNNCDLCPKCSLSPLDWGGCFCDAGTLGLKAACELTNKVVDAAGGITFGKASFHDVAVGASATTSPLTVQFDGGLQTAQIMGGVSGQGEGEGKMDWTWTSVAGLFTACVPQTINIPPTGVSFSTLSLPVVSVVSQETTKDGLRLKLKISGGSLKATLSNPAVQILTANPALLATCPLGFEFLVGYAVAGNLVPIDRTFDLPEKTFEATLTDFSVPVPGANNPVVFAVRKNNLSFGAVQAAVPVVSHESSPTKLAEARFAAGGR